MSLRTQLEALTGREIPCLYESQLPAMFGITEAQVRRRLNQLRPVPILDLAMGKVKLTRPAAFVISETHNGLLIRLLEV